MIKLVEEDMFKVAKEVNILVIPVNCNGVLGAGTALEFAKKYPLTSIFYKEACERGDVKIGKIYILKNIDSKSSDENPVFIFCFPTKDNWRHNSKIEYINTGLDDFIFNMRKYPILNSCVFPALGCGKGRLEWEEVKNIMINKISPLKNKIIFICSPF